MNPLPHGPEWDFELIERYHVAIAETAGEYGLDTYPNQIEIINSLVAQNVKAIVISANDPDALVPALKKAPNCPRGSIRLSRNPPAKISPAMPARTNKTPASDSVVPRKPWSILYSGLASRSSMTPDAMIAPP